MTDRQIIIPGEKIVDSGNFLPGEGTEKRKDGIYSLRFGLAETVDKLVKVIPLSGVYSPRRGNVVIGKVQEITFNGWVMDINSSETVFLSLMEVPRYVNKDGLDEVMDIGDMAVVKIWGINKRGIDVSLKSRGLGKIDKGMIIEINPHKVPRVIGKEGSMIRLIKENTGCNITVGQNGLIWITGNKVEDELFAKRAILQVAKKCFVSGLTEEMETWFKENGGKK